MAENDKGPGRCPRCGTSVTKDAPDGLCPQCLMALNFVTETEIAEEAGPSGTQVAQPPAPAPSPEVLAPYFPQLQILEVLGRGGMGVVYKARQPQLDRFVAVKILLRRRESAPADTSFAERFAREARALARLNHPNIVAVYDYGEAGGYPFLVMEYVEGLTLRQLLQSRKLTPEEALAIVPKICEALQFAHSKGIVHRDIKPENILLDKTGQVKITDFGIAKVIAPGAQDRSLTGAKDVMGTPHYMAPEQIEQPGKVDHRADIFSLGVVFYEMLTGELPLGKFAPPSRKVQVDVRLDEVVLHALEKEPERRYQTASQLRTEVETFVSDQKKNPSSPTGIPASLPNTAAGSRPRDRTGTVWKRALFSAGWHTLVWMLLWGGVVTFIAPRLLHAMEELGLAVPPITALALHCVRWGQRLFVLFVCGIFLADYGICLFLEQRWGRQFRLRWSIAVVVGSGLTALMLVVALALPSIGSMKHMNPPSGQATALSQSSSFGPVIERVVTDSIDLDSGIMEPFPQPLAPRGGDWQVDALYEKGRFVFAVSTRLITLAGNEWVDLSPDRLRAELENQSNPADPQLIMETAKLPVTFGFRTGSKGIGILQVIGYSENPPGVKIRYKLVPQAKARDSAGLPPRQTTAANKTAAENSTARKPEVTAPIEIDLPAIDRAGNALLDLDTGKLLRLPEGLAGKVAEGKTRFSSAEFQDWARSSGADLVCEPTKTPSLLQIGGATGLAGRLMDPDNGETVPAKIEQIKPQTVIRWAETIAPRVAELSSQGMWSHEPGTANIFKTREGGMGVLEIVGYTKNPRGVKIRYRVVRDIVTDTTTQAVPSSSIFGPQVQRTVAPTDANRDGVVAFRYKDNNIITPPVALTEHFNNPAVLGFTPELKQWMQASNMDLLLHLGQKSYDVLTLDMRDGFAGQPKQWDTILPVNVFPVLAKLEALNTIQGPPGIFSGCGYRDGWSYVHGFRTREGLVGYYQLRGTDDLDGRSVEIRYKLVQPGESNTNTGLQLRYLAWQETNASPVLPLLWSPNGQIVSAEGKSLSDVPRPPRVQDNNPALRFLHLWFSFPLADRSSEIKVKLEDGAGRELHGDATACMTDQSQTNWLLVTLSLGRNGDVPGAANMLVSYSGGPWQEVDSVQPTLGAEIQTLDQGTSRSVGQNPAGKAFVLFSIQTNKRQARSCFFASTKDGRELSPSRTVRSFEGSTTLEQFEFDVPLSEIRAFLCRKRPLQAMSIKDVSLEPGRLTHPQVIQLTIAQQNGAVSLEPSHPVSGVSNSTHVVVQQELKGKLAAMNSRLKLTEDQERAVSALLAKKFALAGDLSVRMTEGTMSKEEMEKVDRAIHDLDQQLKSVLTPEQWRTYESWQVEERQAQARLAANVELLQMQPVLQFSQTQRDQILQILTRVHEQQLAKSYDGLKIPVDWEQQLTDIKKALQPVLTSEQFSGLGRWLDLQREIIKRTLADMPNRKSSPGKR